MTRIAFQLQLMEHVFFNLLRGSRAVSRSQPGVPVNPAQPPEGPDAPPDYQANSSTAQTRGRSSTTPRASSSLTGAALLADELGHYAVTLLVERTSCAGSDVS